MLPLDATAVDLHAAGCKSGTYRLDAIDGGAAPAVGRGVHRDRRQSERDAAVAALAMHLSNVDRGVPVGAGASELAVRRSTGALTSA